MQRSISIHAAREGGDAARMPKVRNDEISIHAAREGGDGYVPIETGRSVEFQSTPPVKAATFLVHAAHMQFHTFQSTPPVKAATLSRTQCGFAPEFQSTPPVKAATILYSSFFA